MLKDLVTKNRSYRRFYQDFRIEPDTLKELVDMARLTPSARNMQPLKYMLSCDEEKNSLIFPHLAWAGYLKDWQGPSEGERPSACIIILGDREISRDFFCDHGIVAQTMLLGAVEKGLGGCIIGSINREGLRKSLNISDRYDILLVLALGKPKETVVIDAISKDIKYWRDSDGTHHVPKRSIDEIILPL